MFTKKVISICIVSVLMTGCSSTITAWKNRGVAAHTLRPNRFFTLTGERRLAFQTERFDKDNPPKPWWDRENKRWVTRVAWCAESLPEVSQAASATSKPSLEKPEKLKLALDDSYTATLLQTFARTEISELYRQSAWQSCQAWAQGVYTDDQYRERLEKLLDTGNAIMLERASQVIGKDERPNPVTPAAPATPAAPKKDDAKVEDQKKDKAIT